MRTVSVSKFKASLSEYLRYVQKGDEVLVTDHGRPVARLTAIKVDESLPAHLREMIARGEARMGTGKLPAAFWDLPKPKVPLADILRVMEEEREESW